MGRIILFCLALCLLSCQHRSKTTPSMIEQKLQAFRQKEKFGKDEAHFYPGLVNPTLKQPLTEKINLAADDFDAVARSAQASDEAYLKAIGKGLSRFDANELDTEERERVAAYFEELMDIVGLESSEGQLNNFIYGFDPNH